jgi:hypothetical protein
LLFNSTPLRLYDSSDFNPVPFGASSHCMTSVRLRALCSEAERWSTPSSPTGDSSVAN